MYGFQYGYYYGYVPSDGDGGGDPACPSAFRCKQRLWLLRFAKRLFS